MEREIAKLEEEVETNPLEDVGPIDGLRPLPSSSPAQSEKLWEFGGEGGLTLAIAVGGLEEAVAGGRERDEGRGHGQTRVARRRKSSPPSGQSQGECEQGCRLVRCGLESERSGRRSFRRLQLQSDGGKGSRRHGRHLHVHPLPPPIEIQGHLELPENGSHEEERDEAAGEGDEESKPVNGRGLSEGDLDDDGSGEVVEVDVERRVRVPAELELVVVELSLNLTAWSAGEELAHATTRPHVHVEGCRGDGEIHSGRCAVCADEFELDVCVLLGRDGDEVDLVDVLVLWVRIVEFEGEDEVDG